MCNTYVYYKCNTWAKNIETGGKYVEQTKNFGSGMGSNEGFVESFAGYGKRGD